MNDNSLMPFGKFKGQPLIEVPAKYLLWLHKNGKAYGELKDYLAENEDVLIQEVKQEFGKVSRGKSILDKDFERRLSNEK